MPRLAVAHLLESSELGVEICEDILISMMTMIAMIYELVRMRETVLPSLRFRDWSTLLQAEPSRRDCLVREIENDHKC